jgi:hypothetical protein
MRRESDKLFYIWAGVCFTVCIVGLISVALL